MVEVQQPQLNLGKWEKHQ